MANKIIGIVKPGLKKLQDFYEKENEKDRFIETERSSKGHSIGVTWTLLCPTCTELRPPQTLGQDYR